MMMRKDTNMEKWWNPAWRALLATEEYKQICDDIERVHGKPQILLYRVLHELNAF